MAYLSKLLDEIEWNYEIHNKEMLAVIRELEVWRHLLEGAKLRSGLTIKILSILWRYKSWIRNKLNRFYICLDLILL